MQAIENNVPMNVPIEGASYYPYQNMSYNSIDPFSNISNNNNQLWIPNMAESSLTDVTGYAFVANHGL